MDSRKDLNAYANVENQGGCCSPAMLSSSNLPVTSCCQEEATVHEGLVSLLRRHDINDYAASVQVYAIKGN